MWLDLRDIIEVPGASKAFETALDGERLLSPSIRAIRGTPETAGRVTNTAGLLNLRADLHVDMVCVCDRCGTEFEREKRLHVDAPLAADLEDEGDGEIFPLEGDGIDPAEVIETCFILDMEGQTLCRPDCKGLCPTCGKNLNDGPCGCTKPTDPRLAVLGQLLDINDD